jgi:hypothetical protein
MGMNVGVHNVVSITRDVDEYHAKESYGKRSYAATIFRFECKSPYESHTETFELTFYGPIGLEIEEGTTVVHGESLVSEEDE